MEKITGEEFYKLLKSDSSDNKISDYHVNLSTAFTIDINEIGFTNTIKNCAFSGSLDIFSKDSSDNIGLHTIIFDNCSFEGIIITNCKFQKLIFNQANFKVDIFSILECQIEEFEIDNSINNCETFVIHHNVFYKKSHLKELNTGKNQFNLRKNTFPKIENGFNRPTFINNCQLYNCDIYENDFGCDIAFSNNRLYENIDSKNYFKYCSFQKATFNNTDFGSFTEFKNCNFIDTTSFENIKNDISSNLVFKNNVFKESVSFNKAKVHNLDFNNCLFEGYSFFQDAFFDIIKLNKSIFEKSAFFDNIKIRKLNKCDRQTIRNIKQHLQKSENKIDFSKFRVYEFDAYKTELHNKIIKYKDDKNLFYHRKREIKNLKRDLFILNITKIISDYGTDWKRALKFLLLSGFLLYTLFFISESHMYTFDITNCKEFVSGYFRFLLVTDFYNPLIKEREFLTKPLSWFIFIFGKIVIAFGIYEMIQSFRKFKA